MRRPRRTISALLLIAATLFPLTALSLSCQTSHAQTTNPMPKKAVASASQPATAPAPVTQPAPWYTRDANGWYIDPPAVAEFYASNRGSDLTGDGSLAKPFATRAKAWGAYQRYRAAHPTGHVRIRLECGSHFDAFGAVRASDLTICAYGNGERPTIQAAWDGSKNPPCGILFLNSNNVATLDLIVTEPGRDPAMLDFPRAATQPTTQPAKLPVPPGGIGIAFQSCHQVVCDTCYVHHLGDNIEITGCTNVLLNRSVASDGYGIVGIDGGYTGQGIYTDYNINFDAFDVALFDNGWNLKIPASMGTPDAPYSKVFGCHAWYGDNDAGTPAINLHGAIAYRNASGIGVGTGGVVTDVVLGDNGQEWDLFCKHPFTSISHSAIINTRTCPKECFAGGFEFDGNCAAVFDVIVAHQAPQQVNPAFRVTWPSHVDPHKDFYIGGALEVAKRGASDLMTFDKIVVDDWHSPAIQVDVMRPTISFGTLSIPQPVVVKDPELARYVVGVNGMDGPHVGRIVWPKAHPVKHLEDYAVQVLGPGKTVDDLFAAIKAQDRLHWDPRLTGKAINDWLRR